MSYEPSNVGNPPAMRLWPVVFAGLGLAGFSLAMLFLGRSDQAVTGAPYVWPDVAAVSLLFALPFSLSLGRRLEQNVPRPVIVFFAVALLSTPLIWLSSSSGEMARASNSTLLALRAALAIGTTFGGVSLIGAMILDRAAAEQPRHCGAPTLLALLLVAIFIPEFYVDSRCRRKIDQMRELLSQDRMAEGLDAARELSAIRPELRLQLQSQEPPSPLKQFIEKLTRHVGDLETKAGKLQNDNSPAARMELARLLAQLGRREEALAVAVPLADAESGVSRRIEVHNLVGTIYEHMRDWNASLSWYSSAEHLARRNANGRQRIVALKGMAFSARKLGRYDAAETAHLQLIHVAPTAENDFLLAQFYEDAQQSDEAVRYARRAIRKQPGRYRKRGEALIERVGNRQFGCLGVHRRKASRGE